MFFALTLLAGLAAGDTVAGVRSATATAERLAPASVIVHHQPAIPIVALRMSLQVDDPPGYAGAGYLFQLLALNRLQDQVGRAGGRVQIQRNSDAIVYTVIGPAAELEYLAGVLRSVLSPSSPSEGEMVVALRRLEEAQLAEWETAGNHVRAQLRARLFPADLPAPGTAAAAARFEVPLLRALWAEMYQPSRVSVMAVGDVGLEQVQRVFGDLPAPPRERLRQTIADTVPVTRLAPAESTRGWLGLGYSALEMDPAAVTVAARLMGEALRERLPTAEVVSEHWWTHHGQALALVVASPEAQLAAARRTIGTSLSLLQQELTEQRTRDAAIAVRREMLLFARTPDRMAHLVGSFADRSGDPDALQRFFDDLDRVRVADVRRVVEALAERTPARVDIPPQALRRS
jgi:predicted Zn-dependent peptidase